MFEKAPPVPFSRKARSDGTKNDESDLLAQDSSTDPALRTFDWDELNARLTAARDLREILHHEQTRTIGDHAHDFADAAARFFRTKEERQANVNPVALGQGKGSPGMVPEQFGPHDDETTNRGLRENGDARED